MTAEPTPTPTTPNPTGAWETALLDALASQILQPRLTGFVPDGQGGQTPVLTPSPIAGIVDNIWQRHRDHLIKTVTERLDLDALADKIATHVVADLTTRDQGHWAYGTTEAMRARDRIRKIADEKVAAALAEQMLTDLQTARGAARNTESA